jgi:hypothetical protein
MGLEPMADHASLPLIALSSVVVGFDTPGPRRRAVATTAARRAKPEAPRAASCTARWATTPRKGIRRDAPARWWGSIRGSAAIAPGAATTPSCASCRPSAGGSAPGACISCCDGRGGR